MTKMFSLSEISSGEAAGAIKSAIISPYDSLTLFLSTYPAPTAALAAEPWLNNLHLRVHIAQIDIQERMRVLGTLN